MELKKWIFLIGTALLVVMLSGCLEPEKTVDYTVNISQVFIYDDNYKIIAEVEPGIYIMIELPKSTRIHYTETKKAYAETVIKPSWSDTVPYSADIFLPKDFLIKGGSYSAGTRTTRKIYVQQVYP